MMTVTLWWTDENGSTLAPTPREGPLDEDEASSLTAWVQGYAEVRKTCAIQSRDVLPQTRDKPVQESLAKTMFEKKPPRRDRKCPHTVPRQSERSQHRTYHWSRAEKTHSLQPLPTTWTYGERVSESSTEGHSPIFSQEFLFARRCLCTTA